MNVSKVLTHKFWSVFLCLVLLSNVMHFTNAQSNGISIIEDKINRMTDSLEKLNRDFRNPNDYCPNLKNDIKNLNFESYIEEIRFSIGALGMTQEGKSKAQTFSVLANIHNEAYTNLLNKTAEKCKEKKKDTIIPDTKTDSAPTENISNSDTSSTYQDPQTETDKSEDDLNDESEPNSPQVFQDDREFNNCKEHYKITTSLSNDQIENCCEQYKQNDFTPDDPDDMGDGQNLL